MEVGTGVPYFTKLSETPLKVLTVKNVKLNVQNTFELRWMNSFTVVFHGFWQEIQNRFIFWRLWDNAAIFLTLLSFLRKGVYVLTEKQYVAKFALVFYGFLVFRNMITSFFISYWISLLLDRILECFLFNRVFVRNTKLTQHVHLFFHIYFCWWICPLYRWTFA